MIPLSLLLRKIKASYEWGRKEFKLNHLLFMDDLKLFGKHDDKIHILVQTVFTFRKISVWSGCSKKKANLLSLMEFI